MKVQVTFKQQIEEQIIDEVRAYVADMHLPEPQATDMFESFMNDALEKIKNWTYYGEYLQVEFDLDKMTATVKEQK